LGGVYYIELMEEECNSKIPDGADDASSDGNGDEGDGDGADGDGGGGNDWKKGVDRMYTVWEICFIL